MIQETVRACKSNSLTSLSRKCRTLSHLKQVHARLLKSHLPENPAAIGPLLSVAATSKNAAFFSYACSLFQSLWYRNTFMYNTMIRGHIEAHSPVPAILCYLDMSNSGLSANKYTFPPLIKACLGLVPDYSKPIGCIVHGQVIKFGLLQDPFVVSALIEFYSLNHEMGIARMLFDKIPERDVVLWTAMIDGYGKTGDVEKARALFEAMPERNVISWSAMMAAYSRVNDFRKVLSLFRQMQEMGIEPNASVLVSVLTACAHLGALAQGLWVHSYAKRHNLLSNTILATALVDMYSKCGCLGSALYVFRRMKEKNILTWTAMTTGLAIHGKGEQAMEILNAMEAEGLKPNMVTFTSLFSACCHAGLVKEGLSLFHSMKRKFGVTPLIQHYGCVVDLLGRAGHLKEAYEFIKDMQAEPDAVLWRSLLNACKVHGDAMMGEVVGQILLQLQPEQSPVELIDMSEDYVALSNVYASAERWEDVEKVRDMMKIKGIQTKPGCSSVQSFPSNLVGG